MNDIARDRWGRPLIVPKAALDQLNADWFNAEPNILDSIDKFLTAVDEANRA